MKLFNDPKKTRCGIEYNSGITPEFEEIIKKANDKISLFVSEEVSYNLVYYTHKGEEVGSEHDTCNYNKCIEKAKKEIRSNIGKGKHIQAIVIQNDSDHGKIERCSICEKPLNDCLAWCEYELSYLQEDEYTKENLINNAFVISSILTSMPTLDEKITEYHINTGGSVLQEAIKKRDSFFNRVLELAQAIININFTI